ncbi:MAG: hypothetical protein IJW63_10995 [Lachnospiraceae bacterium]|nr:hypothetical protein [Lachnospiraceae bacterium]
MERVKKSIWDRGYLLVFALLEGTRIDAFVRKAVCLLEPEGKLEQEVKDFYVRTLKSLLLLGVILLGVGVVAAEQSFSCFLVLCLLLGLVAPFWDLKCKVAKRAKELQGEYDGMISRLLLYMGAGLSIQNAFAKTALALGCENAERYIHREMKLCLNYMKSGMLEVECYYLFGQRCDLPEYLRLGGLLAQNAKKGNAELRALLEKEMEDAKDRQRHQFRRRGEVAATKLLGPMMLLLGMVLVMIMIPAFGNLG